MIFQQYELSCLSLFSYLIGDETTGRAVVVDPQRDVSQYLEDAERLGLRIAQNRLRHRRAYRDGEHREQGQDDPEQRAPGARPKYRLGRGGHHLALPGAAHLNID